MAETKDNVTDTRQPTADTTRTAAPLWTPPEPRHAIDPSLHRRTKPLSMLLIAIMVLSLGFLGGWLGAASQRRGDGTTSITQQKTILTSQAAVISSIAKNVGQSVVSVNVTGKAAGSPGLSLFGFGGGSQAQQSAGTGIILSPDGLIMTNRHVVPSGTTNVSVTLSDGTVLDKVKVVGRTNSSDSLDVAFLQIQDTKGKTLVPASIGDSSKVKVGDAVVAIGNALGQFQNTVTSGIISGYGRSVQAGDSSGSATENLNDLFQTDAAINEGNSGGPLVNLNGEVIGMNTAVASNSQSIGFSIPINDITGLIDSVKSTGKLERPYLGVVYVPITSDLAKQYDLNVESGAYIPNSSDIGQETIIAGGPAEKAGLKEGDVITKIDGTVINQSTSITSVLGKHKVGDNVTVTVERGGKTTELNATLAAAPTGS